MRSLRPFLKALLWFAARPSNWRKIAIVRWWHVAASSHWSVRYSGTDGLECGRGVCIGRRTTVRIENKGHIVFAEGAWVGDDCEISAKSEIRIGQGSSVQHRSQLHGEVDMGAGCVCAANLYVASTSHRFRDLPYLPIRWQDGLVGSLPLEAQSERIVIEDDCWLGINVVICPGVTLGRGTVVGANSVVTNSTFPYSVVGGAPARVIGARLAFQPPTSIHSSQQEDIPYFYAGFEVLPTEESWRSASVRGRGVGQRFALALRLEKGELLSLTLHSAAGARLTHGLQEIAIPEGDSTSMIEPHPDMRGLLWFYVNGWSPGCIAIKSAYAIELATSAEAPIPC